MKLLITGGCGFLGSNLAIESVLRGDDLILFDNLSRDGASKNLDWLKSQGSFKFEFGDIRSNNDISRVIKKYKPDAIFHLAGQVAMTTSIENSRMDFETNALGTFNVLEAIRQFAPECKLIYSSTNKVYGNLEQFNYLEKETRLICQEHPNGFNESVGLEFHSPYGCSKGAADQYVLDYARIIDLNAVVFRHSTMYGGRQYANYDQGWIGWFCMKALEVKRGLAKDLTISGTGKQVRDILHADDIKRLYWAALDSMSQIKGEAFNVGGGFERSLSLIELFNLLENMLGINLKYSKLPERISDQKVFVADISKASRLISWEPKINVNEGISEMVEWVSKIND